MITLFADEQILTRSNDDAIILTTHRICYEVREVGRQYNQSIPLEDITSCENNNTKPYWPLAIGIILCAGGLIGMSGGNSGGSYASIILGGAFVGGYFLGGKNMIIISSPSTKMKIPTNGMSADQALSFVNKVEKAKNNRMKVMHQKM